MFKNYYYSKCPSCNAKIELFAINEDVPDISDDKYLLECEFCHNVVIFIPQKYYSVDEEYKDSEYDVSANIVNYMKTNVEFGVFRNSNIFEMFCLKHKDYHITGNTNLRF